MNNATRRYDTIEFNVDSKAEYSALSSTRSQKKKLKQRQCPFDTVQASRCCGSIALGVSVTSYHIISYILCSNQ